MPEIIGRLGILILVILLLCLLTCSGRRFVEQQRKKALAASPPGGLIPLKVEDTSSNISPVRILAFQSADCKQCHQLQTPALRRVQEIQGDNVTIVEVDAPSSPELVHRYHVLTLPTTVILDTSGRAFAVNYGFAHTERLLEQVNATLVQRSQTTLDVLHSHSST